MVQKQCIHLGTTLGVDLLDLLVHGVRSNGARPAWGQWGRVNWPGKVMHVSIIIVKKDKCVQTKNTRYAGNTDND